MSNVLIGATVLIFLLINDADAPKENLFIQKVVPL